MLISIYYIQNIFFILLSLVIIYNIMYKLYDLLNHNIDLFIFISIGTIFIISLIYNLFLVIKDFKNINLSLLSLDKKINIKFILLLFIIILLDIIYIFIFPLFIFKLLNYDKLLLSIETYFNFKDYIKPNYMFPNSNLHYKGKSKELPATIIISNNNQVTITNSGTSITIKDNNIINIITNELDGSKASTSKLLDNNDVDIKKKDKNKYSSNIDLINNDNDKTSPQVVNNYFMTNNYNILPQNYKFNLFKENPHDIDFFNDLFTRPNPISEDLIKKSKSLNDLNNNIIDNKDILDVHNDFFKNKSLNEINKNIIDNDNNSNQSKESGNILPKIVISNFDNNNNSNSDNKTIINKMLLNPNVKDNLISNSNKYKNISTNDLIKNNLNDGLISPLSPPNLYDVDYIINKSTKNKKLAINSIIHNDTGRFYQYIISNNNLLSHKDVLHGIYNTLMNDETFINFGKYKVIIVSGIVEGEEFNYHHNILFTNDTSFEQYYNKVKDILATHFNDGYQIDVVESFKILVWNMDEFANKNIKITSSTVKNYKKNKPGIHSKKTQVRGIQTSCAINKNNINLTHFTPLKVKVTLLNSFATLDIETMEFNNKQISVAISINIPDKGCKLFILDSTINIELAINKL